LARRYVEGSDRPLIEVSALLGFSAPSTFARWYRGRFDRSAVAARRTAASPR
jgi:transcriptional regulator GlxA family with amidase domain